MDMKSVGPEGSIMHIRSSEGGGTLLELHWKPGTSGVIVSRATDCATGSQPIKLLFLKKKMEPGLEKDIQTDNMHVKKGQIMGSVAVWTVWSASTEQP